MAFYIILSVDALYACSVLTYLFHYVSHVSFARVSCHIKEVFRGVCPDKRILVAMRGEALTQFPGPHLDIAVLIVVCEVHEVREGNPCPVDRGLLEELSLSRVGAGLAIFYVPADEVVQPEIGFLYPFAEEHFLSCRVEYDYKIVSCHFTPTLFCCS